MTDAQMKARIAELEAERDRYKAPVDRGDFNATRAVIEQLRDLLKQYAALEAELSSVKRTNGMWLQHINKLGAERDALKVDAERYRLLRDDTREMPDGQRELYVVAHGLPFTDDGDEALFGAALDAAIDAAMNQPKEGQ